MQHAVTAQNEKTHYSNIRNYLFGFRTEIFISLEVDFVNMMPTNIAISGEPIVHLQWIYEYMVSLKWRVELGKYINNYIEAK